MWGFGRKCESEQERVGCERKSEREVGERERESMWEQKREWKSEKEERNGAIQAWEAAELTRKASQNEKLVKSKKIPNISELQPTSRTFTNPNEP